jgi:hypothetical protein
MLHVLPLVAALHWDPQIRGALIVIVAFLVLPGSVYLLLATNNGFKLGFLLAATALTGWAFLLSLTWAMYGIGMKGNPSQWRVKEIVSGDLIAHGATPVVQSFPATAGSINQLQQGKAVNGWTLVQPGVAALADAQSTADKALTPAPPAAPGVKVTPPKFPPPFQTTQDYVQVGGYTKGGNNYLFRIGSYRVRFSLRHHLFYLKHQPHYFVIRVQPSLPSVTLAGAAPTLPAADVTKPLTSVVMLRDEGSIRQPPVVIAISMFIFFAVFVSFLHRRDKEIMRTRALASAATA